MTETSPNRPTSHPSPNGQDTSKPLAKAARSHSGAGASRSANHSTDDESVSRQNIALMQRIKAQDESALEELYDRYSGSVYAIAKNILRHTADAEEVVIDTFWEVWRKADRYDPSRGSVISYLLLLARSRAIDRSRQVRSREVAHGQIQPTELNSASAANPEAAKPEADMMLSERRAHARRLLAELPPERREAIELSFLNGLSHQQIADTLGVPLGTIKTRIRQGLIQMSQSVLRMEVFHHDL